MQAQRLTHFFIVDDSAAIRSRLAEVLHGIRDVDLVGEAETSREAIDGILRVRPDSVLLDLNLGTGNGMEVLRRVRAAAPEIVFVVLTNHSEPQYRSACQKAGARYFLDKSTEFERVRDVIAEIVATRH
jgi:DNA-binding NarL/FixJ family response regulator